MIHPSVRWNLINANLRDSGCNKCSLYKEAITICMMGKGTGCSSAGDNYPLPVMLIGEAPGRIEDQRGIPFVGASGQWLHKALKSLGIEDKCYITNSVRCRPPDNRTPQPVEIAACSMYLREEINILQPKVIVTFGKTARLAMGLDHLTWNDRRFLTNCFGSYYYSPTWHPAYGLRQGEQVQRQIVDTLKWAKQWI